MKLGNLIVGVLLLWFVKEFILSLARVPLARRLRMPLPQHRDPTRPRFKNEDERAGYVTAKMERFERKLDKRS